MLPIRKFQTIEYGHALAILLVYLTTAGHHAYGAWVYETPWRNHIVYQGFTWLLLSYMILIAYLSWRRVIIKWVYLVFSGFFFIGAIGLYEGLYNHVLKNALWVLGVDNGILLRMYPPPKYELPNNWLFEITGILTFVVCLWCLRLTYVFFRKSN